MRETRPSASSSTARSIALTDGSTGPSTRIATFLPSSRFAASAGYALSTNSSAACCRRSKSSALALAASTSSFEPGDLPLEAVALGVVDEAAAGDPDADQDPDDEHQEDGRERRDVVAEVEHP